MWWRFTCRDAKKVPNIHDTGHEKRKMGRNVIPVLKLLHLSFCQQFFHLRFFPMSLVNKKA